MIIINNTESLLLMFVINCEYTTVTVQIEYKQSCPSFRLAVYSYVFMHEWGTYILFHINVIFVQDSKLIMDERNQSFCPRQITLESLSPSSASVWGCGFSLNTHI